MVRGRLMADASGDEGPMLAVQATPETIGEVLRAEKLDLVLANKNSPQQTVLSGSAADIERAAAAFAARKIAPSGWPCRRRSTARWWPLPPSRSASLWKNGVPPGARCPSSPTARPSRIPMMPPQARDLFAGQLARPVEFVREIERLYESGVRTFLEVGPGHRLTRFGVRDPERPRTCGAGMDHSNGQRSGVYDLACCLAGSWLPAAKASI